MSHEVVDRSFVYFLHSWFLASSVSVGKLSKREVSLVPAAVTPDDDIETTTMTTLTTMKPVRKVKKKTKCFDDKHACYLNTYTTPLDKVSRNIRNSFLSNIKWLFLNVLGSSHWRNHSCRLGFDLYPHCSTRIHFSWIFCFHAKYGTLPIQVKISDIVNNRK